MTFRASVDCSAFGLAGLVESSGAVIAVSGLAGSVSSGTAKAAWGAKSRPTPTKIEHSKQNSLFFIAMFNYSTHKRFRQGVLEVAKVVVQFGGYE